MSALDTGTDDLLCHRDGDLVVISFNRPERRNALSDAMYRGFAAILPAIAVDPSIRVVMVTGAGGAFCAGGDVKGFNDAHQAAAASPESRREPGSQIDFLRRIQRDVSLALYEMPKPVVAALPGPAAGAGLSIALACDIRLAAESAVLVTAFSTIGVSGDFGGSWLLTQLVGPARAKELYMLSPRLSARDAADLGIVNQVLADDGFESAALNWCRTLAARAPVAMTLIKQNIERALSCDFVSALDDEATNMVRSMATSDHVEATAAFIEKRTPQFRGE